MSERPNGDFTNQLRIFSPWWWLGQTIAAATVGTGLLFGIVTPFGDEFCHWLQGGNEDEDVRRTRRDRC
jgi:hypothetical protein